MRQFKFTKKQYIYFRLPQVHLQNHPILVHFGTLLAGSADRQRERLVPAAFRHLRHRLVHRRSLLSDGHQHRHRSLSDSDALQLRPHILLAHPIRHGIPQAKGGQGRVSAGTDACLRPSADARLLELVASVSGALDPVQNCRSPHTVLCGRLDGIRAVHVEVPDYGRVLSSVSGLCASVLR